MKKVVFIFLLFLIAGAQGCQIFRKTAPFESVQPGKTLRYSSSFEVIDDFNSGIEKNKYEKPWQTSVEGGAKIELSASTEDSLVKVGGGSLNVHYYLPRASVGKISSELNDLDMSQANLFVARVKTKSWKEFKGKLFIALEDASKHRAEVNVQSYIRESKGLWSDIGIPRFRFRGLDFNRLNRFELILKSSGFSEGAILFDEFAFFGVQDVFFESQRDDIKRFPSGYIGANRDRLKLATDNNRFLRIIAQDVWKYFDNSIDRNSHAVLDHIRLGDSRAIGNYVSPADMAFYWLGCVAAQDLGFISEKEAFSKIKESFATLSKFERWDDRFYYNFYNSETLQPTRRYVSTADNGWLEAALLVVRQTYPKVFDKQIEEILKANDLSRFYDETNGQLRIGFDEDKASYAPYHYGLLVSEARLASYIGIGKGNLPKSHWARIYRTLPKEWAWQKQIPEGKASTLLGVPIFEGYYQYDGKKIVPSWGGSLFEFLAPALLINEKELASQNLGLNNIAAVEAHMDYALRVKKYPVWGISPAAIQYGRQWVYREYGVGGIAAKGYPDSGVIAPYASILALDIKPQEVIANLRTMLELYPDIYGPYGFYEAVDVTRKQVNHQYLALDQGMILTALANYLTNGSIRKRFHADPIVKEAESLLTEEKFFQ